MDIGTDIASQVETCDAKKGFLDPGCPCFSDLCTARFLPRLGHQRLWPDRFGDLFRVMIGVRQRKKGATGGHIGETDYGYKLKGASLGLFILHVETGLRAQPRKSCIIHLLSEEPLGGCLHRFWISSIDCKSKAHRSNAENCKACW